MMAVTSKSVCWLAAALIARAACSCNASARGAETVQFTNQPPQVGQRGAREVQFSLDVKTALRQAGQTISDRRQQITRKQDRQVTVLEVSDNRISKAQVFYPQAREEMGEGLRPASHITQPIEGKTYVVQRRANDLIVTDTQGKSVPAEESVLVAASMDSVGRPGPLGAFLGGKKVLVGQTLRLPNEIASELFGIPEAGGEAQRVELTLRAIRHGAAARIADFDMSIVLKLPGGGTLDVKGNLQLDPDTCQVAAAAFSGPISASEERGPKGHTFEVTSEGTMEVAMRSRPIR